MTKRSYAMLRKKLEELESDLVKVLQLPRSTKHRMLISDTIHQRFEFLKNLLSAERSSSPSKPHHLRHIAQKLTDLEAAFRDWDDSGSPQGIFEINSACSCTVSVLNDDGEAMAMAVLPESSPDSDSDQSYGDVSEVFPEEFLEKRREMEAESGRVRKRRSESDVDGFGTRGRYWRALGSGMMIGVVMMGVAMVRFSGCFRLIEYSVILTPT